MKILILGATGRTGKLILEESLNQGYKVCCLVREPKKIKENHNNLKILKGSPEQISDLENAIKDCDAIISALNISRKSDFPWSKLRTPATFLSDVIKNIISLTTEDGLQRIIVCSAWGVAETEKEIPSWFRWFIKNSNIGIAYKDHERQENELKKSKLNWTIVRPVGLTNFKKEKKVIESYNNKPIPKPTISRKNVAKFMVNTLKRDELIGKTPVISE
ncbi:putative NADH-flavin reductase [Aquimarina sp. EL_43]|uniref:NAD(P)-dependent oxidoreductase n=1 Tax=unclassified Aquimarina TaxID=2627091 RepID=UPI0018C9D2EF|nr:MULTISPECIES: NAD(P)H-binding protein [unclassified Aquimarina]MBG6129164.1 putative NADH-flavin reductase [Aquimarina sp. EL_35]MBG6150229.1 putative NADH-flavin reductase [Aquimarina sp. EL_32]MBG6167086.1 putative NADH-flavin reductase [Aquimarina sp. EL_43]